MAEQSKVELTQSKLDLEGVQVTMTVRVGDWIKQVAISPVDMRTFEAWHEIYALEVVESIVKEIKHAIKKKAEL